MRSVIVIPARFRSSRFPGKPLALLLGKPMILWVAELAAKAIGKENVYVATDDNRIAETVLAAGFEVVMTSSTCLTGTDRLAEAARKIDADIYINVQGDEPVASANDIKRVEQYKRNNMDVVVNCFSYLNDGEDPHNINLPKVITTENNKLIYMSRIALPGYKDLICKPKRYKKQICIYAFTLKQLELFSEFGRKSVIERAEDIEILRFLDLGVDVDMLEVDAGSVAVDVPDDIAKVEAVMAQEGFQGR